MKSYNNQQGSTAHIVIIILLVVAVIGLLGFVFWQNFISKEPAVESNNASTTDVVNDESELVTAPKLAITQWDIGGDYSDNSVQLTYEIETRFDGNILSFSEARLADAEGCDEPTAAGYVVRQTADEEATQGSTGNGLTAKEAYDRYAAGEPSEFAPIAKVGDYYYLMTGPQAVCSEDQAIANIQESATRAVAKFVNSLRAL